MFSYFNNWFVINETQSDHKPIIIEFDNPSPSLLSSSIIQTTTTTTNKKRTLIGYNFDSMCVEKNVEKFEKETTKQFTTTMNYRDFYLCLKKCADKCFTRKYHYNMKKRSMLKSILRMV